jgi:DNA-directed RNA polymerase subunit M/transcription elongation factor TFIIS
MESKMKTPVRCPRCGFENVPTHSELDRRLENDERIPMVCFQCEYKWELSAEDKDRIRKQRGTVNT